MGANTSTASTNEDTAPAVTLEPERVVALLSQGQIEILGQILSSSNAIFLTDVGDIADVGDDGLHTLAIYKPSRGERPLWDFPDGTLCLREVTAYVMSQALGWPLIPPTVLRDGPYGPGAFQLYIDADPEASYFSLHEERLADLLPIALFDVLTNNADRKGGHLLLDGWDRIWAIDNALTFHPEPKLRTVIWDFAGAPIPEVYQASLRQLQEDLGHDGTLRQMIEQLLAQEEIAALQARLVALLKTPFFPHPDPTRRQVPWPLI